MKRTLSVFTALILSMTALSAQVPVGGGAASFDKLVNDFGKVAIQDGPVSCTYTVTNTSDGVLTIYAVMTSCGCTDVKWTREDIAPGAKGEITATYSNDEGPYPFDKTLTVYLSTCKKPVILHLKGASYKKKK